MARSTDGGCQVCDQLDGHLMACPFSRFTASHVKSGFQAEYETANPTKGSA